MRKQLTFSAALFAALAIPAFNVSSDAQESGEIEVTAVQIEDSIGGIEAPMIIQTMEETGDGTSTSSMRIVASDDMGPGSAMAFVGEPGSGMMFGGGSDHFSMLSNPSIRKELELVDDQMDTIREVNADFSKKIREALGDLSKDGFNPAKASLLKETVSAIQTEKKEAINKLLLPHQQERLEQVALQMQMKSRGTANALGNDAIKEALGLSDEQIKQLKERSKELKKEIAEKTAKIKEDAKNELLELLTSEQREKLESMTGDKFETRNDDWESDIRSRMKRRMKAKNDGE